MYVSRYEDVSQLYVGKQVVSSLRNTQHGLQTSDSQDTLAIATDDIRFALNVISAKCMLDDRIGCK